MSSQIFELAILISLKDAAAGGLDRVQAKVRDLGKDGKATLKTFEELRADLKKGLDLGGIGVAELAMLRGGIKTAGDFESAITDLRLSIEQTGKDGALDLSKLNDQMNRFEALGVKLGNQLPGTTQDFIEMFIALKQGGLDTETILKGAGEQVAYLSVLTKSVPKELAKDFAHIGEQFSLKPEEFAPSADKFLRLYRSVGLHPSQLIEGSKFAQLRGGLPLGLKGLSGLSAMSTLLGTLKMAGLEGGVGGRELAAVLLGLVGSSKAQRKADAELRKRGIDLTFFDKKGEFLGDENLIAQFTKLRSLSSRDRAELLKKRFNETALGPIAALADKGSEGYQNLVQKMAAVPQLQSQMNEATATWNAKLESLLGTVENLKATAFLPLLDTIKPIADSLNTAVGHVQEFSKAHPELSKYAGGLIGLSSAVLIATGAYKTLTAVTGLYRIAIAMSARSTDAAAVSMGRAETAGYRMGRAVKGASGTVTIAVKTAAIIYAIEKLMELKQAWQDWQQAMEDQGSAARGEHIAYKRYKDLMKAQGKSVPEQMISGEVSQALAQLNSNRNLEFTLDSDRLVPAWRRFLTPSAIMRDITNPYGSDLAGGIKKYAPGLAEPEVMRGFLSKIEAGALNLSEEARGKLRQSLESAFPESFRKAREEVDALAPRARVLEERFGDLAPKISDAAQAAELFSLRAARDNGAQNADHPTGSGPRLDLLRPPSRAMGGDVLDEGIVHVHRGERIVRAADVTRGYSSAGTGARASAGLVVHGDIHIHVPAGSKTADDPRHLLDYITHEVRRQRERR